MAAKVQIQIEAKDNASGILRGITAQFGQFGTVIDDVTAKNINWGNLAASASQLVVDGLKKSIEATQEYAKNVESLALASGTSTEAASRMIQVLDDYQLTTQDALTATRAMTKEGLAPNIETIALLADRYNSLNTAQEKNNFLITNFGRGGAEWAKLLSQGGDAILRLNSGVNENLVLTQQQVAQIEQYRLNVDALSDTWEGLKITVGTDVIPTISNLLTELNNDIAKSGSVLGVFRFGWDDVFRAVSGATSSVQSAAQAQGQLANATNLAADAAKNSVPDYQSQLSMMQKLTDATKEQIKAVAFQQLQQKLSEGGITAEEAQLLETAGVALGIFDTKAVAAAHSIDALNNELVSGRIDIINYVNALNQIPSQIDTTVTTNYQTTGTVPSTTGPKPSAAGGEVYAGQPYVVGEAGTETFIPSQNGRILGHSESMAALQGTSGTNYFYGNVTLEINSQDAAGITGYR